MIRDVEAVPLARGQVGCFLRHAAGVDFGGHRCVGAVAVDLARAGRPAPDVHLRSCHCRAGRCRSHRSRGYAVAACRRRQGAQPLMPSLPSTNVARLRLAGEAPVDDEFEVAELLGAPQMLCPCRRSRGPNPRGPTTVVGRIGPPAVEVLAVEQRDSKPSSASATCCGSRFADGESSTARLWKWTSEPSDLRQMYPLRGEIDRAARDSAPFTSTSTTRAPRRHDA